MLSRMEQHDKENQELTKDGANTILMNPPPQPSSQRSAGKELRDCPQTPVGRLPLSELLANGDDPRNHQNVTPIERVLWDNSPLSSGTPSSITRGKKRKRAHSSSPTSSSQKKSSKHFGVDQPLLYTSALDKTLETPKADLIDDLWSRYSLDKSERRSPTAHFNAHFPQLLHSSSPNAEGPSREGTGLRRAFSCIDWPTSAVKRRRIMHQSGSQIGDSVEFAAFNDTVVSIKKTKSRVSQLVEKIHSHLAEPIQAQNHSSSDPVSSPAAFNTISPAQNAPLDLHSQAQVNQVAMTLSQADMNDADIPPVQHAVDGEDLDQPEASSDFGDEDFEIGMLEALSRVDDEKKPPQSINELSESFTSRTLSPPQRDEKESQGVELKQIQSAFTANTGPEVERTDQKPIAPVEADDEFGDDGEVVAAELEGILAGYDTQQSPCRLPEGKDVTKEKDVPKGANNDDAQAVLEKSFTTSDFISEEEFFDGDSDFEHIAAEVSTSRVREERLHATPSVCNLQYEFSM